MKEIKRLLDDVANDANNKKIKIGMLNGFTKKDMADYIVSSNRALKYPKISSLKLRWYRKTKNQNIKDKFLIAGLEKNFSVRAEKTMGALPEYQKGKDKEYRFDLSWENGMESKVFDLIMEIEMDLNIDSIVYDFKKILNIVSNKKVMVCQAKTEKDSSGIISKLQKIADTKAKGENKYLVAVWQWDLGKFVYHDIYT